MSEKKIEISLDEAIRVHRFIGEIASFMHQPMKFANIDEFVEKNLEEMKTVYYRITWEWLPEDIQEKLMEE